jgi:hypothetical protein
MAMVRDRDTNPIQTKHNADTTEIAPNFKFWQSRFVLFHGIERVQRYDLSDSIDYVYSMCFIDFCIRLRLRVAADSD